MYLALAGGIGGAKLAFGLSHVLDDSLTVVVNTGDDFLHLGLSISPDLDTVTYTLAGLNDSERGWGLRDETWHFMAALERLGGETWFSLGDRDLATHVERTSRLRAGEPLSQIAADFARRLGVLSSVAPMTDARVATRIRTPEGLLDFQDYFVRRRCRPRALSITYEGAAEAKPAPLFDALLSSPALKALIFCPSNPLLSIDPILSLGGVRDRIKDLEAPTVAVSPLVAGAAIKGPAAKLFSELAAPPNAVTIARHYRGLIDGLLIDDADQADEPAIEALGVVPACANILMTSERDKIQLAETVLSFADFLSGQKKGAPSHGGNSPNTRALDPRR